VLHLANVTQADVGTWHIKLTAPASLASQLVSATVFWQGAVRAIITATPSVKPGQPIAVKLTVLGPNGPISDPRTLASLVVGVVAAGPGLSSPVTVPVTAASGPGSAGTYAGTYTAPSQPTTLTINGSAAGYGLYTTQIPATVTVGTSKVFNATPHFSGATSVPAGGSIGGTVDFTNQTGQAKHVVLKLTASGTTATITPGTPIAVPSVTSGNPPSVPFTVTVDKSAQAAAAQFAVQAVDADTGQPYSAATALVQVTTPPGFFAQYKWIIIGILALIAAAILAALAAYKVNRDRKDVRGLVASLRRGGVPVGRELEPGEKWAEVFPFIIRNEASDAPYLDHPARETTTAPYQVRRAGRGKIRLTTPTGLRPYDIEVNGPGLRMDRGLELSFRDTRHLDWVGTSEQVVTASDWSGSGAAGTPDPTPTVHDWAGSGPRGGADDWSGSGGSADWTGGTGGDDGAPTITMKTPPTPPPPSNDPWL
jgi:hypothetical protein